MLILFVAAGAVFSVLGNVFDSEALLAVGVLCIFMTCAVA